MKEVIKFVWEKNIRTDLIDAEKSGCYKTMVERLKAIERAIATLEEIKTLCGFAEEYGVLITNFDSIYTGINLENGVLRIHNSVFEVVGIEDIENKSVLEILNEILEYLHKQRERMMDYLNEANKYLVVEIVHDDELREDNC